MMCGMSGGQPARGTVDKIVRVAAEDGASTLGDAGRNFFIGWTGRIRVGFGRAVGISTPTARNLIVPEGRLLDRAPKPLFGYGKV